MATMNTFHTVFRPPHFHSDALERSGFEHWNFDSMDQSGAIDRSVVSPMHFNRQDYGHQASAPRWLEDYWVRPPYPNLELERYPNYAMTSPIQYAYHLPQQYGPPGHVSTSSSYDSSNYSDRQYTPLSSPTPSIPCYSPELDRCDTVPFAYGGQQASSDHDSDSGVPCVAMNAVQRYADVQPEQSLFDDEHRSYYALGVQEGYYPMDEHEEQPEELAGTDNGVVNGMTNGNHVDAPNIKHRQPKSRVSSKSTRGSSKASKRAKDKKRSPSYRPTQKPDEDYEHDAANVSKAFPCTFAIYGCSAAFSNKNEWKRHVNTQHMRLGYWRCDQCAYGGGRPNDFNRKDLFIQHIRRMHPVEKLKMNKSRPSSSKSSRRDPDEQALADAAKRCWRTVRASPDKTACLYCEAEFEGAGTWEERLEHIGRHMELYKKENKSTAQPNNWRADVDMEDWLIRERLIKEADDGYVLTRE